MFRRSAAIGLLALLLVSGVASAESLVDTGNDLVAPRYDGEAGYRDGFIYFFGGLPCNNGCAPAQSTVQKYNVATGVVTTIAPLPNGLVGSSIAEGPTGFYLFGGWTPAHTQTAAIHFFSFATETTTALSTMLPAATHRMAEAQVGDEVYLFGGYRPSTGVTNAVLKYTISTGTVETLAVTLPAPRAEAVAAYDPLSNKIYITGGRTTSGTVLTSILAFDVATQTFSTMGATLPVGRFGHEGFWYGGGMFLFGGAGGTSSPVVRFDPVTDQALESTLSTLNPERFLPAIAVVPGAIGPSAYLLGGVPTTSSTALTDIWVFTPDAAAPPVPEAATLVLLGAGLVAMVGFVALRRRA